MTTKELYNHFNNNVYSKLSWGTDLTMIKTLNKVRSEINVVSERPGPRRTTLRTFEYKDFRYVETINNRSGRSGQHLPHPHWGIDWEQRHIL